MTLMMISRSKTYLRAFIVLLLAVATCSAAIADSMPGRQIPVVRDFAKLAASARENQLPILLMVSQDHCAFCQQLKTEVLNPMMISGDYVDRAVMAELQIDEDNNIIDFDGKSVYPGKIAADYHTWVTPTLLFLDYQGKEVHKRMLGVNTIEMYGYYLDESLEAALTAVKKGEPYAYISSKKDQAGISSSPSGFQ